MEYVTQPIRTVPRFPKAAFSLSVLCTDWAEGRLSSSQALYRSFPCKHEKSLTPLFLLSSQNLWFCEDSDNALAILCGRYPSGGCYSVFKGERCSHLFAHEQPICIGYTCTNFQRIKGKKKAPAAWPFFQSATSASRFAIPLFGGFICLCSLMEVHIWKKGTGLSGTSGFPVSENPVLANPIQAGYVTNR